MAIRAERELAQAESGPPPGAGGTEPGYDRALCVHDLVAGQAAIRPEATALQFGARRLSYGELDRLATALAGRLAARGVGKGDIVGLLLPRGAQAILAMLATLKAGAAYAPFDPAYPAEHLAYMIGDCAPKAIFTDRESMRAIGATPDGMLLDIDAALDAAAAEEAGPRPVAPVTGADAAYVMYTSGSTGRPKGVVIPHRGITRLVRAQNYVRLGPRDAVLHAATISFDAATFEIWGALANGCRLVGIADRHLSVARLVQAIDDGGVSVALLTTGLFHLLADHPGGGLSSLRHMLFGGEVASAEHIRRFQRAHPDCLLTNAYGPTEVTVMASAYAVPAAFAGDDVPIGRPIAHGRVHIVDADLRELPAGREGQLAVSGDGLAIGYLNRPELTAECFVAIPTAEGGPTRCYLTGDMAVMGADGNLRFRGRRDRQVKIDGKRIELDEIEAALRRDARLSDAAVTVHEGRIVAYLRPRADAARAGFAAAVLETLRGRLPAHMVPGRTVELEEFPLNRAGKVDRARLPLPEEEAGAAAAPPAGAAETLLAGIWRRVLGRESVPPDRNFFDLGGTSLQLVRVHAALEEALGRPVDVVALFGHPTIRELAAHLDGRDMAVAGPLTATQRAAMRHETLARLRRSAP